MQHIFMSPFKDVTQETELKLSYNPSTGSTINCAQQMPCADNMNISDNADALYNEINHDTAVENNSVEPLLQLYIGTFRKMCLYKGYYMTIVQTKFVLKK